MVRRRSLWRKCHRNAKNGGTERSRVGGNQSRLDNAMIVGGRIGSGDVCDLINGLRGSSKQKEREIGHLRAPRHLREEFRRFWNLMSVPPNHFPQSSPSLVHKGLRSFHPIDPCSSQNTSDPELRLEAKVRDGQLVTYYLVIGTFVCSLHLEVELLRSNGVHNTREISGHDAVREQSSLPSSVLDCHDARGGGTGVKVLRHNTGLMRSCILRY